MTTPYRRLQARCKAAGLPANKSMEELARLLAEAQAVDHDDEVDWSGAVAAVGNATARDEGERDEGESDAGESDDSGAGDGGDAETAVSRAKRLQKRKMLAARTRVNRVLIGGGASDAGAGDAGAGPVATITAEWAADEDGDGDGDGDGGAGRGGPEGGGGGAVSPGDGGSTGTEGNKATPSWNWLYMALAIRLCLMGRVALPRAARPHVVPTPSVLAHAPPATCRPALGSRRTAHLRAAAAPPPCPDFAGWPMLMQQWWPLCRCDTTFARLPPMPLPSSPPHILALRCVLWGMGLKVRHLARRDPESQVYGHRLRGVHTVCGARPQRRLPVQAAHVRAKASVAHSHLPSPHPPCTLQTSVHTAHGG